ncbi:MAG: DMT family transporter [Neorhizobium sp.]|nr:DMT family transporter [Neorhizobium sp.]
MLPRDRTLLAILFAATAAALTAVDAAIVRLLAGEVHPFVIGFFRCLCGLMTVLPWILWRPAVLKTRYRWLHLCRSALKLLSLVCGFAAFAEAALADVTAIMFTAPIFVMLGAWLVLKEALTVSRIAAILAGFAGALIIISPSDGDRGEWIALMLAVTAAALQALVQLMLKKMSSTDSAETLVVWNLILTVPIAAVPAVLFWETPTWGNLSLLILQGILGAANMALITKALAMADASHVASVEFLRLPFVAAIAWLMFGEIAGLTTWGGAALIIGAVLLPLAGSAWRRRQALHQA